MNINWSKKIGGEITSYFMMKTYMDIIKTSIIRPTKKREMMTFSTTSKITHMKLHPWMLDWEST